MSISSKYQRDYSATNFDNPRLLKIKEQRRLFLLRVFVAFGGVMAAGVLYFLFYSSHFRINNYEINGLEKIRPENIENILNNYFDKRKFVIFSRRNYWLVDKTALKKEISRFYYFEKLDVKRKFPNRLIITVVEKQALVNWVSGEVCAHVDMTGSVIGFCENDSGRLTIRDLAQVQIEIGKPVLSVEKLQYIVSLHDQVKAVFKEKFSPLYYELDKNILRGKSDGAPDVLFNLDLGIGEQVGRLDLILRQQDVKDNWSKLKYIDLRFGEKVFYK